MKFFKHITALLFAVALMGASPASTSTDATTDKKVVLTKDNVIVMDQVFMPDSVAAVALKARELDSRLPSGDPLYLVLYSPGGSIDAGLELIDNLSALNRPVNTVTLFSASMAFQTVQGLGKRYVSTTGTLMSHKARGGFQGEFPGQFDSRYAYYLKRVLKLDEAVVARSSGKLTLEKYRAMYANEYWCDGQDCVDAGVADAALPITCDKSLDGTRKTQQKFSFMGIPIEVNTVKAACPTITAVLEEEVKIGGKNISLTTPEDLDWLNATYGVEQAHNMVKFINNQVEKLTPTKNPIGY